MIEVYGNLWAYPADARVITTNGYIKTNGAAVMGRGCAYEATQKIPEIQTRLGNLLGRRGNHVFWLGEIKDQDQTLSQVLSFPVKHRWYEKADISLIIQSAYELVTVATALDLSVVVVPRPGCGNGQLQWEGFDGVKIQLVNKLDDRFHIITKS